jgi:uncharacterized protein (DUF1501 family)
MQTSRRNLLKVGLGALPVISLSASVPSFVSQMAFADQAARPDQPNDNVLVVLQLTGGNDGLNTVIPFTDDAYHRARPKIGIKNPGDYLRLNEHFALNPGLAVLRNVFNEGHLAVVHGCGYPNPNRSHFRSMEIWHTANPDKAQPTGWLGHFLDHAARGSTLPVNPLNIGKELPQALVNLGTPVPSVEKLEDFRLKSGYKSKQALLEREIVMELNKPAAGAAADAQPPAQQFLARQATNAIVASQKVQALAQQGPSGSYYPGALGQHLQLVASLISANAGTRLFYVQYGNFDTHAQQAQMHQTLFQELGQSLWAFHADLKSKGVLNKVTVMVFSEFGRRVAENSSQGTDHGAAAPMFVMGGKVKGGLHGQTPSLTDLDDGDLKHTTDFRRVYATLLDRWLNCDSSKVLGGKYEHVPFV